jgi:hypothetical protein
MGKEYSKRSLFVKCNLKRRCLGLSAKAEGFAKDVSMPNWWRSC